MRGWHILLVLTGLGVWVLSAVHKACWEIRAKNAMFKEKAWRARHRKMASRTRIS